MSLRPIRSPGAPADRPRTSVVLWALASLLAWMPVQAAGAIEATTPAAAKATAPTPPPGAGPAPVLPFPMHVTTLDNKLRVVVVPTESAGRFALYGVVGVGSRDEVEPGHSGFAHFFEHMMFRGTRRFPANARTELLATLGVDESGFTTDDFTGYNLQGPTTALAKVMELEGDRYANLWFDEDAFKTESKAVLGEYNKNFASPDNQAYETLRALAFDEHPYEHTTMGFLEDIRRMPKELAYARFFFKRFYTPDNLTLVLTGDVQPEAVVALVRQRFGGWRGKRAQPKIPVEPPQTAERRTSVAWKNPTLERMLVAWRVPSSTHPPENGAMCALLSAYLFSDSSPLVKQIVLDEELAENVSPWWDAHRDPELFPVNARIKAGHKADEVLTRVQSALDALAAGRVDAKRFADVKSNLRYGLLMGLTSADAVAKTIVWAIGPSGDPRALDATYAAIANTEPAALAAFVRAHFTVGQRSVVTLAHEPAAGAK